MRFIAQRPCPIISCITENKLLNVWLRDCDQGCDAAGMKRLIPVLIAVLIGSTLPLYAQDCCDPGATTECHHPRSPKSKTPCQPSLSVCPDSACLMQQKGAIAPTIQSGRLGRPASELSAARFNIVCPEFRDRAPEVNIRPPINRGSSLFLRNQAFLI